MPIRRLAAIPHAPPLLQTGASTPATIQATIGIVPVRPAVAEPEAHCRLPFLVTRLGAIPRIAKADCNMDCDLILAYFAYWVFVVPIVFMNATK
jgi:hypothetical protein